MALLSIIVPVYNAQNTIEKCLKSLLCQTLKDIEIIVVNDCSTDDSKKVIENLAKNDKRIFVTDNLENMGAGASRNKGVLFAKGKYIGFVDNDDWADLTYFEEMIKKIEEEGSDLCVTLKIRNHKGKAAKTHLTHKKDLREIVFIQRTPPWAKVYKKDFLTKNKIQFTDKRGEDILPAFLSALLAKKISFISNSAYNCSIRKNSISHSPVNIKDLSELEIYKHILSEIKSSPDFAYWQKLIKERGLISFDFLYKNAGLEIKKEVIRKYSEIFSASPFPNYYFWKIKNFIEKATEILITKIKFEQVFQVLIFGHIQPKA